MNRKILGVAALAALVLSAFLGFQLASDSYPAQPALESGQAVEVIARRPQLCLAPPEAFFAGSASACFQQCAAYFCSSPSYDSYDGLCTCQGGI